DYCVNGQAIIVNLGIEELVFYNEKEIEQLKTCRKTLKQWESSVFTDITVKSAHMMLIMRSQSLNIPGFTNTFEGKFPLLKEREILSQTIENEAARQEVFEDKWEFAGSLYPAVEGMPLWKTKETLIDEIGPIVFDPYYAVRQEEVYDQKREKKFMVKCYMWFSPKLSHCGIHNNHKFIEIHTQISGVGRIPKFLDEKEVSTIYEDNRMAPGHTLSEAFCRIIEDNTKPQGINFVYPWHEYYSDTDCIWLVSEFHPVDD
ncbi:MAG: hypothetical protein D3910_20440, partial [Candidatus Electrothrix sp. ATG2]|nr:hypothetical protein [Candidatus Electrothrix sp. ATG2]